jgi:PST family polysaccharide transporter
MSSPPPGSLPPGALRRKAISGFGWQGSARLLSQGASWAATLVAIRFMTPEAFGAFGLTMAWMAYAQSLGELGLRAGLVSRRVSSAPILRGASVLALAASLAVVAFTFLAAPSVARWVRDPMVEEVLRVCVLALPIFALGTVPLARLEQRLEFKAIAALEVEAALVAAGVTLVLALGGAGVWAVVGGWVVQHVVRTADAWRRARLSPFGWAELRGLAGSLRFGLWVMVDRLLVGVPNTLDAAFVGRLAGPASLGLYTMAQAVTSSPIRRAMPIVQSIAFPVFSTLREEPGRLGRYIVRVSQGVGLLALPALVGVALVARDLVDVFLADPWLKGVGVLRALALIAVFRLLSAVLIPAVHSTGRPDLNVRLNVAAAVFFPLGFWLAGRAFGPVAGVVGTLAVGYTAILFFRLWILSRLCSLSLRSYGAAFTPVLASTGLMVASVLIGQTVLRNSTPELRLAVSLLVGVAAYATTLCWGFPKPRSELRGYLSELSGQAQVEVDG